jgi:heme-degrading monooxygenase HmoA
VTTMSIGDEIGGRVARSGTPPAGNRWLSAASTGQGDPVTAEPATEPAIAATPEPPYVAVIFTSLRTPGDNGYARTAELMGELARQQPGYLGLESARDGLGITVSYWRDEESARAWKQVARHHAAQRRGRDVWYSDYRVRVAVVTRDYGPDTGDLARPAEP